MPRQTRYFQRHHTRALARRGDAAAKGDRVRPRLVGDLLATLNEPTHLRILNSVSRVPLSVPDLAAILELPEPIVSAAIETLQNLRIVRAFTVVPHVLYTLAPLAAHHERLARGARRGPRRSGGAARPRRGPAAFARTPRPPRA